MICNSCGGCFQWNNSQSGVDLENQQCDTCSNSWESHSTCRCNTCPKCGGCRGGWNGSGDESGNQNLENQSCLNCGNSWSAHSTCSC